MKKLDEELRLTSVYGSGVEYVGYVELDLKLDGWRYLAGLLVIKETSNSYRNTPIYRGVRWPCALWRHLSECNIKPKGNTKCSSRREFKEMYNGMAGIGTLCVPGLDVNYPVMLSNALVIENYGCIPIELLH